jgi:hypothetical protein
MGGHRQADGFLSPFSITHRLRNSTPSAHIVGLGYPVCASLMGAGRSLPQSLPKDPLTAPLGGPLSST